MTVETAVGPKGRLAVGLLLIAIGLLLTLEQAGIVRTEGLGRWWPLFLLGVGFIKVRQPIEDGQRAMGVAMLLVGGLMLLFTALSFGKGWPLFLVVIGGFLLWRALFPVREAAMGESEIKSEATTVSEIALMGGFKKSMAIADFRGGYITAVMGGGELDLRRSTIQRSPVVLDVVALWGGMEIKVPPDWLVESRVVPIAGGVESRAQTPADTTSAPRFIIRGYAVMGGIVVGN